MLKTHLSIADISRLLDVSPSRVSRIVAEKRAITPDTAIRLGNALGTGPEFWVYSQAAFDLAKAAAQPQPHTAGR